MEGAEPATELVQAVSMKPMRKSKMLGRTKRRGKGKDTPGVSSSSGRVLETDEKPDRRKLCEEILRDGFVQSYVDFFYLTHRPDPTADAGETDAEKEIDVPPDEMLYIRENLTQAEAARRKGDTVTVYTAYANLAQYFQNASDPKTGVYFYEKCLEIARLTGDKRGEMAANHDLGLIHQRMDEPATATKYHERQLELAGSLEMHPEVRVASQELARVYRKAAEEREKLGEFDGAVGFYQKCLESSQAAADRASEGLACYSLGRSYVMLEDPIKAIGFLDDYETICKDLADVEGEGQACAALAAAYQTLHNDERALEYLERCLQIATETENLVAQGDACCTLGVIHNKRTDFESAVAHFERNFEIARQIIASGQGETALVDMARVYLGMARGNAMLKTHVHVIENDFRALLNWKIRRVKPAADGGAPGAAAEATASVASVDEDEDEDEEEEEEEEEDV